MEKPPSKFKTGQEMLPHEQKRDDVEGILKKWGDKVRDDASKVNRAQFLETLERTEGWGAAQREMTEDEINERGAH